jgi:spore germination protein
MRTRTRGWLLWVLGAVTLLSLVFGLTQYSEARSAKTRMQAAQQRALFNLVTHVENLEASLAKAWGSSSTGQQVNFLTSGWLHCQAARSDLSLAGADGVDLTGPRRFVATVGDYALVLSQKLARGETVTAEEWAELGRLERGVKELSSVLSRTAQAIVSAPGAARAGLVEMAASFTRSSSQPRDSLNHGFSEIDQLTQSIPAPVYDGPFSEKNLEAQALARPGPLISDERAKEAALSFLTPGENFQAVFVGTIEGAIPSYLVTAKRDDGSEVATTVAKQGGAVVTATDSAPRGAGAIGLDEARAKATEFLKSKGFLTLEETGWRKRGPGANRVVFAYVPYTELAGAGEKVKVRLYPDTVKVEVSLDTGTIVSFDQLNYLVTHGHPQRVLKEPLVSAAEARRQLKASLQVEGGEPRLCVIPVLPTTEVMAWEFRVRNGDDTYLVYINAMTGKEQVVLQLIEDESGAMSV